jgi:hypothetical protein
MYDPIDSGSLDVSSGEAVDRNTQLVMYFVGPKLSN